MYDVKFPRRLFAGKIHQPYLFILKVNFFRRQRPVRAGIVFVMVSLDLPKVYFVIQNNWEQEADLLQMTKLTWGKSMVLVVVLYNICCS